MLLCYGQFFDKCDQVVLAPCKVVRLHELSLNTPIHELNSFQGCDVMWMIGIYTDVSKEPTASVTLVNEYVLSGIIY
jgi:hypothetical protein